MLTVRCTAKLLDRLRVKPAPDGVPATTRLGDWYATVLPRQPAHLILLVNEPTRLPVLLPAREYATLAVRIPDAIAQMLHALGAPAEMVEVERMAMANVRFDRTASRSVLGTMNEFSFMVEEGFFALARGDLFQLSLELARQRMSPLNYDRPLDVARRALGIEVPREGVRAEAIPQPPAATRPIAQVFELDITLHGVEPKVWRRVRVRSGITLFALHRAIQAMMGWQDYHLHEFRTADGIFGIVDEESPHTKNDQNRKVCDVLRANGDRMEYAYDFGDGWQCDVQLARTLDLAARDMYPCVVDGARACPPEDCGGIHGYEQLLKVLRSPRHPEHRDCLAWVGGALDPEAFDVAAINRALQRR